MIIITVKYASQYVLAKGPKVIFRSAGHYIMIAPMEYKHQSVSTGQSN